MAETKKKTTKKSSTKPATKKTTEKSTTTSSSTSTSTTKRTWSSTKVLDFIGYFAMVFIAIALILRLIFKNNTPEVERAFTAIGECMAYIICMWLGLYWVLRKSRNGWNKRNIWWLICWIVAAVVIIIIYIFAII